MAKANKSKRKSAKTAAACKTAGGRPVHFKGMKKGEVVCFTKAPKRKKSSAKKATKKSGRKGNIEGLKKACRTMKKEGFKGKRAKLKAACAAIL
jgi:hypothetical protein